MNPQLVLSGVMRKSGEMAGDASACSCAVRHSRPSSAPSNAESSPASPRTPICKEGRLDSTVKGERVGASPPRSPFAAPVKNKEISLRENGAALSLIERLDDAWYRDNVVSWPWWNALCDTFRRRHEPTTTEMIWASRDLCLPDKGSSSGTRTPDANGRAVSHLSPFRSIEMVQPLVGTSISPANREGRDFRELPRSRLRRLKKGLPDDEMSLSDGEQKRYRASRHSKSQDLQIEPAKARAGLRRRKEKQVAEVGAPPRRFSDGEEPAEEGSPPLERVREEGESEVEGKTQISLSNKNRDSPGLDPATYNEIAIATAGKQQRGPQMEQSNSLPAPPARRRRRERKKSTKSLSDVEYDELRGCLDLGFNLSKDDLTPGIVGVFPALEFYKGGGDYLLGSPKKSSPRNRGATHAQQGWGRRADSPLSHWRLPSAHDGNVDMKAHLKFWAHSVASSVSAEC